MYKSQILKLCLWSIILAMGITASDTGCPVECICLGNAVMCKDLALVGAPNGLPPWTKSLTLAGNNFANLEFNSLSRLPELQELDVSSNNLTDNFTLSLSTGTKLLYLKVDKNHLALIPDLKLAFLTHLLLSHNSITTINGAALQGYPELQNLDLTSNRLTKIQPGSFLAPNKLKLLIFNQNQIVSFHPTALQNLTSLQELRLNKNHLTSLKDFLKNLDKLRILEVNKNELREIQALLFDNLKNLEKLRLKRNKIEVLHDGAFWPLNNLRELQLDYNNLLNVSKGALFGLENVRTLTMSHNRIGFVQHQAWEMCKNISELDLSHNNIKTIDQNTFSHLIKLNKLVLDDNSITTIEGSFKDLISLKVLELNSNKISYIVEDVGGTFLALTQLQKLGIAHNQIKSINKNAFIGLSHLTELDLMGNDVTSIQENAFLPLTKLSTLKMNSTSLFCDCGLKWLSTWLETKQYSHVKVKCGYPAWLSGTSPTQLHQTNFTCDQFPKPQITKEPEGQLRIRGDNLNLTCAATTSADAPLTFTWKRNNVEIRNSSLQTDTSSTKDGITESSSVLFMRNVTDSQAGIYQCIVTNTYGTTYSTKIKVVVYVYPTFTKLPSDVHTKAGETARLECSAIGHPTPQIAWQKDGGNDFPAARERRMHKMPADDMLFIINVKALDSGVYSCTAQNLAGIITANATVTILETPSFVKPMENKEVAIGGSIVLECMASGSPKPELAWRKNGSPLQATERHFFTAENQLLIIVNTVLGDAGTYECELSNSLGRVIGSSFVTVKDDIKSTPSIVNEDDILGLIIITVVCCAVGTSIIWVAIIYQTRRRLNNHNASRKTPVIMSSVDAQADSHLNMETSSQHSKDSGTGGSANPSDNQLHIYSAASSVSCVVNNEEESVNIEGANPLLSYTNHDRHSYIQN